ncbi:MAG: hypothetical protein P9M03_12045 [Candidatus Theseobacter exili]|nr:hypothetical protein [Candidatus Theseobacter exili]
MTEKKALHIKEINQKIANSITSIQRKIMFAIPAGTPGLKKENRSLSFFILCKILHMEKPGQKRNIDSALKVLEHKGLINRENKEAVFITNLGLKIKEKLKND